MLISPKLYIMHFFIFTEKVNKQTPLQFKRPTDDLKLNDVSYRSWRLGSLYEESSNGNLFFITENFQILVFQKF